MGKPTNCIGENKGADLLHGNCKADQRLCFRYTDSTIILLLKPKFQASSLFLRLYRPVCVGPGQNPNIWFSDARAQLMFSVHTEATYQPVIYPIFNTVITCMRGENCYPVLNTPHNYLLFPFLLCQSLQWCEYRRMVRNNQICVLLHSLLHDGRRQVICEQDSSDSMWRTGFHKESHIVPAAC